MIRTTAAVMLSAPPPSSALPTSIRAAPCRLFICIDLLIILSSTMLDKPSEQMSRVSPTCSGRVSRLWVASANVSGAAGHSPESASANPTDAGVSSADCGVAGAAYPDGRPGERPAQEGTRPSSIRWQRPPSGGTHGRLVGAPGSGTLSAQQSGRGGSPEQAGPWSDFDIIPCRDPKHGTIYRRIEPGAEPLVDGLPGRVGLLRGYGDAIVPQVAATFIGAFLETSE